MSQSKRTRSGFTLIELLVVISIIGLLASVVIANLNEAKAKSLDVKRMNDIMSLQIALEAYYNDHGEYPMAVTQPGNIYHWGTATCDLVFAGGSILTPADTSGPNAYIQGLTPKYLQELPVDPGPPPANPPISHINCYGYVYKSDGNKYIILDVLSPNSYPTSGRFYDPTRPANFSWRVCSDPDDIAFSVCGIVN